MKTVELQLRQGAVRGYLSPSPMAHRETTLDSDLSTSWTRKDAEVRFLVQNVPRPPLGYDFNNYQHQQQANFFKWTQDRNVPMNNVDVYNANIIAVCMFTQLSYDPWNLSRVLYLSSTEQCFEIVSQISRITSDYTCRL